MKKLLVIPLFFLLTGCSDISVLYPKSTTGEQQAFLIWFSLGIMTLVIITVFILFARFVSKYRYTKDKDGHMPKDVKGNLKLELTWTIVPILLLITLAVPSIIITYQQSPITSAEEQQSGVHVDVVAEQFKWTFTYEGGKSTENHLVIPEDETIHFHLQSKDVIHSFWIPELAGKVDVIPDREITYEIEDPEKGTYQGKCAEYCGAQHANMNFDTEVVSKDEYEGFITSDD